MEKVFEIYIKTTPERLWEAITDGELRAKYNFGVGVKSDWTAGSTYEARHPSGVDIGVDGSDLPERSHRYRFALPWSRCRRSGTSSSRRRRG